MPESRLTMLDVARANAADNTIGLIDEVLSGSPEFALFPSRTIRGTTYQSRFRIGLPNAEFRSANQGISATKSQTENRLVQTFILDELLEVDVAVATAFEFGAAKALEEEAQAGLEAAINRFGTQCYYGNPGLAANKGFAGMQYMVDPSMVVDAGGTTAAEATSVYAVKLGERFVSGVFGNDTPTLALDDWATHMALDADNKRFKAYYSTLNTWVGLQCVHKYAVARIKNITTDSGKTLDDGLLTELLEKFPVGIVPDAILMSRRSRGQLRNSRTASGILTNSSGAVAPLPTEVDGIRIVVTDSIVNTEALAA